MVSDKDQANPNIRVTPLGKELTSTAQANSAFHASVVDFICYGFFTIPPRLQSNGAKSAMQTKM
jgi:hypothetical protein